MARVGIDLDGVCYDFAGALRAYLHSQPRTTLLTLPDPVRWEFYKDWGFTTEQFVSYCNAGVDAGVIFTVGDPTEDAPHQLMRLRAAGHTVHIITDRSFGSGDGKASRVATMAWLAKHDIPYDTLDFTGDKASVPTDVMIDDKIENFDALTAAGCNAFLLDRPWNQRSNGDDQIVHSLKEFVDYVLEEYLVIPIISGEVRTTSSTGGEKGVKPQRFDLIPVHPLTVLAEHYGVGARKYSDNQWMKGYEWSKSYQALLRHLTQWWGGEDLDPETGSNHVAAVAWHSFALLQFIRDHPQFDDRPKLYDAEPTSYPDIVDGDGDTWEFHHLYRGVPQYVMRLGSGGPYSEEMIRRFFPPRHPVGV